MRRKWNLSTLQFHSYSLNYESLPLSVGGCNNVPLSNKHDSYTRPIGWPVKFYWIKKVKWTALTTRAMQMSNILVWASQEANDRKLSVRDCQFQRTCKTTWPDNTPLALALKIVDIWEGGRFTKSDPVFPCSYACPCPYLAILQPHSQPFWLRLTCKFHLDNSNIGVTLCGKSSSLNFESQNLELNEF